MFSALVSLKSTMLYKLSYLNNICLTFIIKCIIRGIEIARLVSPPAGKTPDKGASGGSSGIYNTLPPLRKGCAG